MILSTTVQDIGMNKNMHKHWNIVAYDEIDDSKNYVNHVEVTVLVAINEEWAIKEAKQMVKRNHYVLRKIWECNQCKLQEKTEKFIDKHLEE